MDTANYTGGKQTPDEARWFALREVRLGLISAFDIRTQPGPRLTKQDREQVKRIARELLDLDARQNVYGVAG